MLGANLPSGPAQLWIIKQPQKMYWEAPDLKLRNNKPAQIHNWKFQNLSFLTLITYISTSSQAATDRRNLIGHLNFDACT